MLLFYDDRKVSLLSNSAFVEYYENVLTVEDIIDEIEDIGFTAKEQSKKIAKKTIERNEKKAVVAVSGMTCATCSGAVEKGISAMRGVESMLSRFVFGFSFSCDKSKYPCTSRPASSVNHIMII